MLGEYYRKIMQVIVNREELVEPLAKKILLQEYKKQPAQFNELTAYIEKSQKRLRKTGLLDINFAEVNNLINKELLQYKEYITVRYKSQYRLLVNWLANKYPALGVDNSQLVEWYADPTHTGFTKNISKHIVPSVEFVVNTACDHDKAVLIRNIINNEELLTERLRYNKEFWFVDSGYTNFIAAKGKPWHRLVHNHIHQELTHMNFPADRIQLLDSFPRPWRKVGNKILVVESSDYHYQMFGTNRDTWRDNITNELAKHTDRPVEYRAKDMNRKTRQTVYELLMSSDDYYCVISDSSAAAVEAVWAGVPIITLNRHITNPVAKNNVADINDLYYGPIGDWLCALTYSQFTKKEMQNGTAFNILSKYHA